MTNRVKLDKPFLLDLPQPPQAVAEAIDHWIQWLRFLPAAGPKVSTLCAGIERDYAHITRKLQAQYHPAEPDESQMYDWKLGESMERHINTLPLMKKTIIRAVHIEHLPVPVILYRQKIREEQLHQELKSAYNMLAGKICPTP